MTEQELRKWSIERAVQLASLASQPVSADKIVADAERFLTFARPGSRMRIGTVEA